MLTVRRSSALLVSLLTVVFAQKASASKFCAVVGTPKSVGECNAGCTASERFLSVRFPDGRVIGVLGHTHGVRKRNLDLYTELLETSTAQFADKLAQVRASLKPALSQVPGDLAFVRQYTANTKAKFLGAEVESSVYPTLLEAYRAGFAKLRQASISGVEDVLAVTVSLPLYLDLTRPKWMGSVAVKGFESRALVDTGASLKQATVEKWQQVRKTFGDRPQARATIIAIRRKINELRTVDQVQGPQDQAAIIQDVLNQPLFAPDQALVAEYIQLVLDAASESAARDQAVAERLAKERASGLLVVGHDHLLSLGRRLREQCLAESQK